MADRIAVSSLIPESESAVELALLASIGVKPDRLQRMVNRGGLITDELHDIFIAVIRGIEKHEGWGINKKVRRLRPWADAGRRLFKGFLDEAVRDDRPEDVAKNYAYYAHMTAIAAKYSLKDEGKLEIFKDAERAYEGAIEHAGGNKVFEAYQMANLAQVCGAVGNYQRSLDLYLKATHTLSRAMGDQKSGAWTDKQNKPLARDMAAMYEDAGHVAMRHGWLPESRIFHSTAANIDKLIGDIEHAVDNKSLEARRITQMAYRMKGPDVTPEDRRREHERAMRRYLDAQKMADEARNPILSYKQYGLAAQSAFEARLYNKAFDFNDRAASIAEDVLRSIPGISDADRQSMKASIVYYRVFAGKAALTHATMNRDKAGTDERFVHRWRGKGIVQLTTARDRLVEYLDEGNDIRVLQTMFTQQVTKMTRPPLKMLDTGVLKDLMSPLPQIDTHGRRRSDVDVHAH